MAQQVTSTILMTQANTTTKCWAQFNKLTGAYTGLVQLVPLEKLNQDYFNYVEVDINPTTHKIIGTYDDWEIVSLALAPRTVTEVSVDNATLAKIEKVYPIYTRLGIIEEQLLAIASSLGATTEAFTEMLSYIAEVKRVGLLIKADYESDPNIDFLTYAKQQEIKDAQLEGGLHEFIGPRELSPSIVVS